MLHTAIVISCKVAKMIVRSLSSILFLVIFPRVMYIELFLNPREEWVIKKIT